MATYMIRGQVTISCHTIVEADSAEQAKLIAVARPTMAMPRTHESAEDVWIAEEMDGEPMDLEAEED